MKNNLPINQIICGARDMIYYYFSKRIVSQGNIEILIFGSGV